MSDTEDGRRQTEDGRFDAAIDRAVREMLDVEPPAELRGRVVQRIARPRRLAGGWMWVAGPVAAAAVIILAVVLPFRQAVVVPVHNVVAATAPLPAVRPGPMASAAATAVPTVPDRTVRAPASNRTRVMVAMSAPGDTSETGAERLAPIDPINIAPVRYASIAPSDIAIVPLAPIAPLQLEPLSPPDRR